MSHSNFFKSGSLQQLTLAALLKSNNLRSIDDIHTFISNSQNSDLKLALEQVIQGLQPKVNELIQAVFSGGGEHLANEEGGEMTEMIKGYFRKLPDGEAKIKKQQNEMYPDIEKIEKILDDVEKNNPELMQLLLFSKGTGRDYPGHTITGTAYECAHIGRDQAVMSILESYLEKIPEGKNEILRTGKGNLKSDQ